MEILNDDKSCKSKDSSQRKGKLRLGRQAGVKLGRPLEATRMVLAFLLHQKDKCKRE